MEKFLRIGTITIALLATFSLAGCGQSGSSTPATGTDGQLTKFAAASNNTTATNQQPQNVYMTIEAGSKLGSDGKLHDAFIGGDITVTAGRAVKLTIYNYDDGTHTYSASELGLNVKVKGSEKKGEPSVTTYTFTPKDPGTYRWNCLDSCDGENGQWAMSHDGYMQGTITVVPATENVQHVSLVVNPGYKLGSDGKLHDAFTPGNFEILAGEPVELTIYNFDDGKHTLSSKDLGVNVQIEGSKKKGEPSVTTYKFTPTKSGTYKWNCLDECDGENGQWAMTHDDYMMGNITVK